MLLSRFRTGLVLCLVVMVVIAFAPVLWAQEEGKININEAGIEELAQLQNILWCFVFFRDKGMAVKTITHIRMGWLAPRSNGLLFKLSLSVVLGGHMTQ